MVSYESLAFIEAKLNAFMQGVQPEFCHVASTKESPLVILYGQTRLGAPRDHTKLQKIQEGQEAVKFKECEVLLRGTLKDHVLFRVVIHNSSLQGCTLIGCIIYGSLIEESQMIDCCIREKRLKTDALAPTASIISNCQIENGAAYYARIFDSFLKNLNPFQTCKIDDSYVIQSQGTSCTMINCGIDDSKLCNCNVSGGVLTPSVTQSKVLSSLRRLPAEVRRMIFLDVVAIEGSTTSLIAAMRPDSLLYGEVSEVYFQKHVFILSDKNKDAFKSVPVPQRQRITKLQLQGPERIPTGAIEEYIPIGTKITSIELSLQGRQANVDYFYDITKFWFKHFGMVTEFAVIWKADERTRLHDPRRTPEPPRGLLDAIEVAKRRLGRETTFASGKLSEPRDTSSEEGRSQPAVRHDLRSELNSEYFTWKWIAGKGQALLWEYS